MTFFMLCRSIATRDENCSVRFPKGDRPFVETRAIDFTAEFSPIELRIQSLVNAMRGRIVNGC
jgi:hypothetical protein